MSRPEDYIIASIVANANAEAKFTRATVANLNAAADQLTATKKSMLDDMSKGMFETPQEALDSIMKLQGIQKQVDELKTSIESKVTQNFTDKDVDTISDMKRRGMSEEKIAGHFGTNQTKINRLLHGKVPVEKT